MQTFYICCHKPLDMELAELKSKLPHGAIREISKQLNISECTISCVLSGKRKSPRKAIIISALVDYIAEQKRVEQEARQKLDAILKE